MVDAPSPFGSLEDAVSVSFHLRLGAHLGPVPSYKYNWGTLCFRKRRCSMPIIPGLLVDLAGKLNKSVCDGLGRRQFPLHLPLSRRKGVPAFVGKHGPALSSPPVISPIGTGPLIPDV